MRKNYLLLLGLVLWSFLSFAILPVPTLVAPTHGASAQDVNVYLDWGNSAGATFYEYKLSTNSSLIGASAISTGANSYLNTSNLLFGTTYYWSVRAKNASDSSDWSLTFQFTTHDNIYQVSPTNGAVSQDVNTFIDWSTVNGITYYDIEIDTNATFSSTLRQYQSVTSSYSYFNASNLLFATKYYWRVRARHSADTTTWSPIWNFTTHDNIYQVSPSNGAVSQDVNTFIDWSTVNGITYYDIEIDTNATFSSTLRQYQSVTSSYSYFNASNLLFATKYYWRVRARHSADTTTWSPIWNFTTHDNIYQVSPSNGAVSQDVNTFIDWSTVNGITYYDIEIDTNATFSSTLRQYQSVTSSYSYFNASNLLFATKYYWRVRARHSADTTTWSPIWNFTTHDNIYQVSPTNGAVSQDVNTFIDWSTVSGITYYDIEIDTNTTFSSTLRQYQSVTSSYSYFNASNLLFATKYYWRVRARHSADTTTWSPIWNFTTHDNIYQVSPSNGAVSQDVNTFIDWSTVNGISYYDIEIDTNATFNSTLRQYQSVTSSYSYFNASNLLFATKYYWRVRARHSADTTTWSPIWNYTTTEGKPAHVSPSNGATGVSLNPTIDWSIVSGVNGYQYEYSIDSTFASAMPATTGTTSQAGLVSLSYGETYFWRVRCYHPIDTSEWSYPWKFTTLYQLTTPVLLSSPANGSTAVSSSTVTLQWQSYSGAVFYEYSYSTNPSFAGSVNGTTISTTVNTSSLSEGITYYWKVRANNGSGFSPWSTTWSFTTSGLGTPILISPANGSSNQPIVSLTLDWQDVTSATFYEYQYGTDVNFASPTPVIATSTVSTSTLNGLAVNTTYYWRVRSNDGVSQSPWSSVWSFTTSDLEVPTLVSPMNGVVNQQVNTLVLDWNNTSNTTFYEIQYSTDVQFVSPVSSTTTVSSAIINNLDFNTTYYWRVRSNDGNSYSSWSVVWSFTTISNIGITEQVVDFKMYPNPVNDRINIEFKGTSNRQISLFDYVGNLVYHSETTSELVSLDVKMLKSGNYILKIQEETSVYTRKIVKL